VLRDLVGASAEMFAASHASFAHVHTWLAMPNNSAVKFYARLNAMILSSD